MTKISKQQMIEDFVMPDMESHVRGLLALLIDEELKKFAKYVDGFQWANSQYPNAQSLLKTYLESKEMR